MWIWRSHKERLLRATTNLKLKTSAVYNCLKMRFLIDSRDIWHPTCRKSAWTASNSIICRRGEAHAEEHNSSISPLYVSHRDFLFYDHQVEYECICDMPIPVIMRAAHPVAFCNARPRQLVVQVRCRLLLPTTSKLNTGCVFRDKKLYTESETIQLGQTPDNISSAVGYHVIINFMAHNPGRVNTGGASTRQGMPRH
jgi:hypothetical protein